MAMHDERIYWHALFDELEGRFGDSTIPFRWDGEGWVGTDTNRLWVKTEGFAVNGAVEDGRSRSCCMTDPSVPTSMCRPECATTLTRSRAGDGPHLESKDSRHSFSFSRIGDSLWQRCRALRR